MRDTLRRSIRHRRLPVAVALPLAAVVFLLGFIAAYLLIAFFLAFLAPVVFEWLPAAFEDILVAAMYAASACFGFWGSRKTFRSLRWRLGFEDGITCARCRYNLTGLIEPRCPECGQPFEPRGDVT